MGNLEKIWHKLKSLWWRSRKHWASRWGIDISIMILLVSLIGAYQSSGLIADGKKVPNDEVAMLGGGKAKLLAPGKKTVLYVWSPHCPVCSAQSETFSWASGWFGDGTAIRSVAAGYRDIREVESYAKEHGFNDVFLGEGQLNSALKISGFPTFYVISEDGRVEHTTVGYTTMLGLFWRVWI